MSMTGENIHREQTMVQLRLQCDELQKQLFVQEIKTRQANNIIRSLLVGIVTAAVTYTGIVLWLK